jgi:uncharacterized Zn-binding protein involved in type VI secretion
MPKIARLRDTTSHGGVIISASPTVYADNIAVARKGDKHSCPIPGHGITNIVTGSPTTFADGIPVARIGDITGCGATIDSGSPKSFADG